MLQSCRNTTKDNKMEDISKENNKENFISVSQKIRKSKKLPKSMRSEHFVLLSKIIPKEDNSIKISFLLAYGSGMRISEVLKCEQKHFDKNRIFIPESKNGVERYVPIPKGWKEEFFKNLPLSKGSSIKTGSRRLQRGFKKYCKLAKLPEFYTFHSLRHGFATRCLESGMPLNQVQMLLGHDNIATTSIYVKANPIDAIKNYMENF